MRVFAGLALALILAVPTGCSPTAPGGAPDAGGVLDGGGTGTDGGGSRTDGGSTVPDGGTVTDGGTATDGGTPTPGSGRTFPDTTTTIAILADQLPSMDAAQQHFAATHYVGTQKLTLAQSKPLRAINPDFLVLHYHLAMWQSAPNVPFIIDGQHWGNDYSTVTQHEDWFWHNPSNQRVASDQDGKLLMNVSNPGFQAYWASSLAQQVAAGDDDAVFLDSASPVLLQYEAKSPPDPRIAGTGVKTNTFPELGGKTWIEAWDAWIAKLDAALAAKGIPLIPNTGPFITSWDTTDYDLTAGIFAEGFSDPGFATSDWVDATNEELKIVGDHKIVILQNYLSGPNDVAKRMYLLANYLLVKGARTYLDYFAHGPLEWYPEWDLDLGAAEQTATTVSELAFKGVYRRDFAKGIVLVNPGTSAVTVPLGGTFQEVVPQGGGAVDGSGHASGSVTTHAVTSVQVPAKGAEILLR